MTRVAVTPALVSERPVPVGHRLPVADLDRRLDAFAIDRVIAWGLDLAVAVVVHHLAVARGRPHLALLVVVATVFAVGSGFALLLGRTGRTPGLAAAGLRVVSVDDGRPIGVRPALQRSCVLALATLPFGFGLAALALTVAADPSRRRRGWHDHLVGSVVVDDRRGADDEPVAVHPRPVVNLSTARLVLDRRTPDAEPAAPTRAAAPTTPGVTTWALDCDTGDEVVVDRLILIGGCPVAGVGEEGARLVALAEADRSVSPTHARVVVAPDGALVVTDLGSAGGTVLRRRGVARHLGADRPATLLEGDVVTLGDRSFTVRVLAPGPLPSSVHRG